MNVVVALDGESNEVMGSYGKPQAQAQARVTQYGQSHRTSRVKEVGSGLLGLIHEY